MTSKKFFMLRDFLLALLLISFVLPTQAQRSEGDDGNDGRTINVLKLCDRSFGTGGGDVISDCPDGTVWADVDNTSCTNGVVPIAVFCLDLGPVSGYDEFITWPTERDPVYLRYAYDENTDLITNQITQWQYVRDLVLRNGQSYKVFQGAVDVNVAALNNLDCGDGSQNLNFDMDVEILTYDRSNPGYYLYPVDKYGFPGDIFSCDVFPENCHLCNPLPGSGCGGQGFPVYTMNVCLDCDQCNIIDNDPLDVRKAAPTTASTLLRVQPNPFSTFTEYEYQSSKLGEIAVRLLNSDGTTVLLEKQNVSIGKNRYRIEANDLPSGVYYLQIRDGEESQVQRLIKMD